MNTAVRTLDRPGDSIVFKVPGTRYTVTLTWTEAGQTFTVTVDQGTYRLYELGSVHDLVNDPHAETKARQRARQLAAGLMDGMSVEALAQCVAMAATRQRVLDAPAAQIDAEFAAITTNSQVAATNSQSGSSEMQVGTATLQPYHPSTQREVPGIEQVAPDFGHRNTSHLAAADTSDAMDVILLAAAMNAGRVARSQHATSRQLIALKKRRLVELVYGKRGATRVIVAAELTAAGRRHAASLKAVA